MAPMKHRQPEVGSVLSFDPVRFPMNRLFFERARELVGPELQDLSRLHEIISVEKVKSVLDVFYGLVREPMFVQMYEGIIDTCIAAMVDRPFRFQRVPSIRVLVPHARTVQFHSDYWYGHGPEILNLWMPITRSFGTNALRLASDEDSVRATARLVEERARQPEIDERLAPLCKPVEIDFGQVQVFNSQTVHGSVENTTDRTRVSIDFRVMLEGVDPGSKDGATYYRARHEEAPAPAAASPVAQRAASYIFPKYGFTRHIPAFSQRAVVDTFAMRKGLSIVTEETEIFPMTHHPTLLNLAAGKGAQSVGCVVLFSVLCMPRDVELREELFRIADASGVSLCFANESLEYPGSSRASIEAAFTRALEA